MQQMSLWEEAPARHSASSRMVTFLTKCVAFKWSQGEKIRSLAIGEVSPTLSTDHNPAVYQIERE